MVITFFCGLGHVFSSVVLGLVGLLGISVSKLVSVESFRGNIAAWLFIAFGLVYMILSIRNLLKNRKHSHSPFHVDGNKHVHEHDHHMEHTHFHHEDVINIEGMDIFPDIFFGPCEPLIPILMYPAAKNNFSGALIVSVLFSVTIATMMSIVLAFNMGFNKINLKPVEKYSHLIAGAMIFFSVLLSSSLVYKNSLFSTFAKITYYELRLQYTEEKDGIA